MRLARPVSGLGDATALDRITGRAFRGHETQIADQLARILKAGEITDLGQQPHSRNEINPKAATESRQHERSHQNSGIPANTEAPFPPNLRR